MAISFGKAKGGAQKSNITYMEIPMGVSTFRLVGGLLPRYIYWIKNSEGKNLPFECLQYDREAERFDRTLADPVAELNLLDPNGKKNKDGSPARLSCQWAYTCQVLNRATGQIEVLGLKKKMLEDMKTVWESLEVDPTDLDEGIEFVLEKKKTGPLPINIEYNILQLRCKKVAASDEDRAKILEAKSIDELLPRATVAEQRAALAKFLAPTPKEGSVEDAEEGALDDEAMDELE